MSALIGEDPGAETAGRADEIRAHLTRVLASPAFRTSKRCARFLEYIVGETLNGRAATLKERTLAIEVFDRSASWDAGDDTIVRVGAREVRKRLTQFYAGPEATNEKLRIALPLGSYVPDFVRAVTTVAPTPVPKPEPLVPLPVQKRTSWRVPAVLLIALILVSLLIWRSVLPGRNAAFETFWQPFLHSRDPVIIAVAHPLIYLPSARAYRLNAGQVTGPQNPSEPLKLPPEALNGADFVPAPNEFLAFGDAAAATDVKVLLAVRNRDAHLRFASKVEFADLREAPAVTIGAFSNRWTVELTEHLRYHFGFNRDWVPAILDARNPDKYWTTVHRNGTSSEDYFLVCRLANSPSGNMLVAGAGVGQLGTEAAGRFLTSPERLTAVLQGLRPDWAHRNLELLLHARVIGNTPVEPDLVASYVW